MILSHFRYRPVTVPLPLQRYRDRPSATVTDRYRALPNVTSVTCVTQRYKRYRALQNVAERYIFYLIQSFKWTVSKLIYCLRIKLLFINMFISFFI
jgi:hypothetical protein